MWTANLACSPARAGSERRPGPQGCFPFFPYFPTPWRTPPWWETAWQRTTVSVCVCVLSISCFIEWAEFACIDQSGFHCEKQWQEKDLSHDFFFFFLGNRHHFFWEHFDSLVKVHQLSLSQTLRKITLHYSRPHKTCWNTATPPHMFSFTFLANKMKATLVRRPRSLELNLNASHEGIWVRLVWATGPPVVSWPSAGLVPFTCLLSTLHDWSPKKLHWRTVLLICTENIWIKATGFDLKNGWLL